MIARRKWAAALALGAVVAASACRRAGPPPAIPADMAACVPSGAVLLAGAKLDTLRASPLYPRLPASALAFLKPWENASTLLVAFNGAEILLIEQGSFREAASGATLAAPNLMLAGSPALIQAGLAQRRSGSPGSPDLFARASSVATGHAAWIATRGNVNLPLTGDAENLNRLLRLARFATLGLRIQQPVTLDFTAQCATADNARHLEETLRAILSLSSAGLARRPELAALLRAVDLQRQQDSVHASLAASDETMPQILELFAR